MAQSYSNVRGNDPQEELRRRKELERIASQSISDPAQVKGVVDRLIGQTKNISPEDFDNAARSGMFTIPDQRQKPPVGSTSSQAGWGPSETQQSQVQTQQPNQTNMQQQLPPDVDQKALAAADAQALKSFQERIRRESTEKAAQQEQQRRTANRPHWADEWEQQTGKKFDTDYASAVGSEKMVEDPDLNTDYFSSRAGGWRQGWSRLTPEERVMEMRQLAPRVEEFEAMRQQLTENYERMDPVARSHYNDMQKRIMGLEKARGEGKLNQLEFMRSMEELNGRSKQVKWKYHFRAPGSQPGEITEQNGVEMMRTASGDLEAIAFTPQYVQERTIKLPDGSSAVPLKPGGGYQIVKPPDDESYEAKSQSAAEIDKRIDAQWKISSEAFESLNGRLPEPGSKEMKEFEDRVHAEVISKMELAERIRDKIKQRSKERATVGPDGKPVEQLDALEEVMSRQYQESQQEHDKALQDHNAKLQSTMAAQVNQQNPNIQQEAQAAKGPAAPRSVYDVVNALPAAAQNHPELQATLRELSKIQAKTRGKVAAGSPEEQQARALVRKLSELVKTLEAREQQMKSGKR